MPTIRRSNRIQIRKTNQKTKQENITPEKHTPPVKSKSVKPKTVVKSESPKVCSGCKNTHPPIRRYNIVQWVQCENCDSWWHAECVCLTAEDIIKLDFYDIHYTCILCILKGSPWIAENNNFSIPVSVKTESKPSVESDIIQQVDLKQETADESKCSMVSDCDNKPDLNSNHIVIVDNIKDAQNLKSSKSIKQKLDQHPEFQEVDFAYSLPRGGVAIHFNSEEKAIDVLKKWPGSVFSKTEKPHQTSGKVSCSTGFIKNIDTRLSDNQLRGFFDSAGCKIKEVRKVFHRHSGKPMPIRKVSFESESDLRKAIELQYPFRLNGKQAFCEKEEKFKVVRCFSCHRFNHIAANCPLRIHVRTVDQKTTSLLVIAENRVHVQIVVGDIKVQAILVLNILKFYRGDVKTSFLIKI